MFIYRIELILISAQTNLIHTCGCSSYNNLNITSWVGNQTFIEADDDIVSSGKNRALCARRRSLLKSGLWIRPMVEHFLPKGVAVASCESQLQACTAYLTTWAGFSINWASLGPRSGSIALRCFWSSRNASKVDYCFAFGTPQWRL